MSEQMLLLEVVSGDGYRFYVKEHDIAGALELELSELEIGDKISIEKSDMTEEEYENISDEIEDF